MSVYETIMSNANSIIKLFHYHHNLFICFVISAIPVDTQSLVLDDIPDHDQPRHHTRMSSVVVEQRRLCDPWGYISDLESACSHLLVWWHIWSQVPRYWSQLKKSAGCPKSFHISTDSKSIGECFLDTLWPILYLFINYVEFKLYSKWLGNEIH